MTRPRPATPPLMDPELIRQLGRVDLIANVISDSVKQGIHRSCRHGFSTEFSEFKPYGPGDDLRFLDWRVYARTDRLLCRKYEAETSFESLLLLDASRSMAWRFEDTTTKLEYATNLLAALAHLHVGNQDLVGLVAHDGKTLRYLPARSSRNQLHRIYEILETVQPAGAPTLPAMVEALAGLRRHRGQVVICSDLEESEEETRGALEMLAARDDEIVVLHLLDQAEIELPFRSPTHLVDSETGEELRVDLAHLKRTHARTVGDFTRRWKDFCEDWGFRYHSIHTAMSYMEVLLRLVVR